MDRIPGGGPIGINFIGHSLGCRLVMEVVRLFASTPPIGPAYVDRVVLMAAAVPVFRVDPGGSLAAAAAIDKRTLVLCSEGDTVLHWAFPIGQTAGGDGFFPSSVGRDGHPSSAWTDPAVPMVAAGRKGHRYQHGDYWGGVESAAGVAGFFGQQVDRQPPVNAVAERALPAANSVPSRSVAARALPDRSSFPF